MNPCRERRCAPRVRLRSRLPLTIHQGSGSLVCYVLDISLSGALVQCPVPLAPRATNHVSFRVSARGTAVHVDVEVVRRSGPRLAGLRFMNMADEDRERLNLLIRQRARLAGFDERPELRRLHDEALGRLDE